MKSEEARELLVPHLDGELDVATNARLLAYLDRDPAMRRELAQLRELLTAVADAPEIEVDPDMRREFDAMLGRAKRGDSPMGEKRRVGSRVSSFPSPAWTAAAAVCVVAAGLVGWFAAWRVHPGGAAGQVETAAEVEALRRDIAVLRDVLLDGSLQDRSPGARLQTIGWAEQLDTPDPAVLEVLITALETDPIANVRLAALEALRRHVSVEGVRTRLADSLDRQTDPLVQIALIGVLVDAGVPEARAPLERLLAAPEVIPSVKSTAQRGLVRL
ncbi:hypothetical protein ASA1KI_38710 [Opitutales bacterium ASA1]|uniref:HEAT repeat domain-containing protein n=1 Tax=Congregicoccus parvus TaxID=3081749 RepID=UPI002B28D14C|nr:hypothetical protein ASA1KI_38710 [Opitutales bacterium ASA1]